MPTTQATVHATVCILLAIWTATLWRSMHAPGVCEEDEELCSADCLGRGACIDGRCTCDAGFTGPDCRQAVCPSNCSGRGECQDGICVCQPRYGAYDCSVDRLRSMAVDLLEGVTFDLQLEKGNCEFITKRDVNKAGGSSIAFHDPVTKAQEVFDVPAEMLQVLPASCPGLRYRTCAVVGNSGTLRFGSFGDAIDAHDMVYRFNQAPTDGYEQYVGRRTTFESLNSKFAHSLAAETPAWLWRENTSSYIFFEPLKLRDTYVTVRRRYPSVPVLLFSPHFFARAHQVYDALQDSLERSGFGCFEGEKPMSGFYGTLYALAVCEQVSLFGFDPWTDSMMGEFKFRYHYFDADEPRPGAHSFDASFFMYELMALSGRYNFTLRVVDVPQGADFGRRREHDDDGAHVGGVVQSDTVPLPDDVPEKGTIATMA